MNTLRPYLLLLALTAFVLGVLASISDQPDHTLYAIGLTIIGLLLLIVAKDRKEQ